MPTMVKALRLCDALESNGRNQIEVRVDAQPRQLPSAAALDADSDPVETCCSWLFENQVTWQDMQDLMRARYLEYVIGQFKTKTDAAKWLGVGSTYLCKLSKTVPHVIHQNPMAENRLLPS
jgi:hypothetical protein